MIMKKYQNATDFNIRLLHKLGVFKYLPDVTRIKMCYQARFGKTLDLDNPRSFNEKLQWLKVNVHDSRHTILVDKYEVKKYMAQIIGEEHIIPTFGVWDSFEDIDFDELPGQFVLKCTHDSGGLSICRDKKTWNLVEAKQKIEKCLSTNYYFSSNEWPYKNIHPRIIAEKYMENVSGYGLRDYKFYVLNGKVRYLYISEGLENHATASISFLTPDWKEAPFGRSDYRPFKVLPDPPVHLQEMISLAEKLSEDDPFRRVDLYEINDKIYFSEITFFPCSGMMPFAPKEWDMKLGEQLDLTEIMEKVDKSSKRK